ncbi:MAG TPA: DsrE/DsrF/DrsH-like family protein [Candidatus Dormibacteraeota bacterium]|jgi:peroxiredoxin family protein
MSAVAIEKPAVEQAAQKPEEPEKLVIFAWSGELDKIWPTLILATTGAAMGKQTTVFFTFWGLFPLVKNEVRMTGENWMQKMLSMMNRGGDEHLKLSKMNFGGAGKAMMMHLSKEHQVASPHELMDMAKEMGVKLIPCQMTMDLMGLKREDLIDGLEEPAGATSALAEAQGAITLFI